MHLESLRDAAGNVLPTDECECGRPKLASKQRCCSACGGAFYVCADALHSAGCNMRCATMGVPGFGVRATDWPAPRTLIVPFKCKRITPSVVQRERPRQAGGAAYFVAELAGQAAREMGRPATANPYRNRTRGGVAWHNAWRRGWERG